MLGTACLNLELISIASHSRPQSAVVGHNVIAIATHMDLQLAVGQVEGVAIARQPHHHAAALYIHCVFVPTQR